MQPALLPRLDPGFFDRPGLTALDVRARSVPALVVRDNLVASVRRIRLVDCGLSRLPAGLAAYTRLTVLDLSENALAPAAGDSFAGFAVLEGLDLTANRLSAFAAALPPSLQTLHLSFNRGLDLRAVWAAALPRLEALWATHCGLTELPGEPPPWAATLRVLRLGGNEFAAVPPVLARFPALEDLCLFGNALAGVRGAALRRSLRLLNLSFNRMRAFEGFADVAALGLTLSSNFFDGFPVAVFAVRDLKQVLLARCKLRGVLDFELPPTLLGLDLSHNKILGVSERFAASMRELTALNVSYNRIAELPDAFPAELCLTHFLGDHNRLKTFPASLLSATKVEHFSCASNCLESLGEFHWPSLKVLNLSFNRLTTLPDCFRPSSFLRDLNVSFNRLTALPRSISACRKLVTFIGVSNQFRKLPPVLGACAQLKAVSLSGNLINTFPQLCLSLRFVTTLDLSNNHFSELPSSIQVLKSLKMLSFSHNAIEVIPDDFTFPPELTHLDLSFNKLQHITLSLPALVSLSLDYNRLTEFDPTNLPKLHFLSLNSNRLSTPLSELLPDVISKTAIRCLEYLSNDAPPQEAPPTRVHVLESVTCNFTQEFGVGYSGTLGERPTMEDAVVFRDYGYSCFLCGVFDGHTGSVASAIASRCLAEEVAGILGDPDLSGAFARSFTLVNEQLKLVRVPDGCTVAAVLVVHQVCFIAGVGDSRVVRVRRNDYERSTRDSKPLDRSEYERLRAKHLTPTVDGRIDRKLAVARSLGDFYIGGEGLYVEPQIYGFEVGEEDVGMVIACDGLWDVISDGAAADVVRSAVTAADAAVSLRNFALGLGSKDNISVVVLLWHTADLGFCGRNTVELLPIEPEEDENEETPPDDLAVPALPSAGRSRRR